MKMSPTLQIPSAYRERLRIKSLLQDQDASAVESARVATAGSEGEGEVEGKDEGEGKPTSDVGSLSPAHTPLLVTQRTSSPCGSDPPVVQLMIPFTLAELNAVESTDDEDTESHSEEDFDPQQHQPTPSLEDILCPASFAGETDVDAVAKKGASATSGCVLSDTKHRALLKESSLFGKVWSPHDLGFPAVSENVYLNTHEPFCITAIGVQGSGKSHTLSVVLESCLIPCQTNDITALVQPMNALVLHYDSNLSSVCEATGMTSTAPYLQRLGIGGLCLKKQDMVVLVSPTYYLQRKQFYGDTCTVKPLLFRWNELTADHLKCLMRLRESDNQLYVATLLDLLRSYQRQGQLPAFSAFLNDVHNRCRIGGQQAALQQRLALLESFVVESALNESIAREAGDLNMCRPGSLVIVDLTDPLMCTAEVNGVFQVLTEQYRAIPSFKLRGKLLALDEAHKFMDGTSGCDGLSAAIVNCARLMRHDGLRLVISTQSPKSLAPELLELTSLSVLHRFFSQDWFSYLEKKLPLTEAVREQLINLDPGRAVVFAARHNLSDLVGPYSVRDSSSGSGGSSRQLHQGEQNLFVVSVRKRLTADRGASKVNAASGNSTATGRRSAQAEKKVVSEPSDRNRQEQMPEASLGGRDEDGSEDEDEDEDEGMEDVPTRRSQSGSARVVTPTKSKRCERKPRYARDANRKCDL